MTSKINYIIVLLIYFIASSCVRYRDTIIFNDALYEQKFAGDSIQNLDFSKKPIRPNDFLEIEITAEGRKLAELQENKFRGSDMQDIIIGGAGGQMMGGQMMGGQNGGSSPFGGNGYLLDNQARLKLPSVGYIELNNKTLEEAEKLIEAEFKKIYEKPFVIVKYGMYKATVINTAGVVNAGGAAGGLKFFTTPTVNILDFFGVSSSLNKQVDISSIRVIRTDFDGQKKYLEIDLSSVESIKNEAYNIQPDDIVVLIERKTLFSRTELTSFASYITIPFTLLNTALLFISLFNN
jgi:polysaccharide export outer membrane protein